MKRILLATTAVALLAPDLAHAQSRDNDLRTATNPPASNIENNDARLLLPDKDLMPFVTQAYVDPATVTAIKILATIVSLIQENRKNEAEAAFQQQVIGGIRNILISLGEVKQQITELGVKLDAAINQIPFTIAENKLYGAISAAHSAYPALRNDRERAIKLYDELNSSTAEAAKYGPALLPTVAAGIVTLDRLHQYTGQSQQVRRTMYKTYVGILQNYISPTVDGSLASQLNRLNALASTLEANIRSFVVPPQRIGTHNYGGTWVIENVRMNDSGWFEYWLTEQNRPQERLHPPGEGPEPRFFLEPELAADSELEPPLERPLKAGENITALVMYTASEEANPVPESEVILYTTGNSTVPTQAALSAAHGEPPDQHYGEWHLHALNHSAGANPDNSRGAGGR
ncbi:MAG: hypothetical protein K0R61_5654 [Microvirga sp.]|nr:hypothetical protein [Microvirga sp.]